MGQRLEWAGHGVSVFCDFAPIDDLCDPTLGRCSVRKLYIVGVIENQTMTDKVASQQPNGNLFNDLPKPADAQEQFKDLLNLSGVRIERRVSTGLCCALSFW